MACFVDDEDAVFSDCEAGADPGGEAAAGGLEVAGNDDGGGRFGLIRLLISSSFLDEM